MAAESPDTPNDEETTAPDRRSILRGISTMGLAAFVAPIAVRPQDGNPITDLLQGLTGGGGNEPAPSSPPPAAEPPKPSKPVKDYKPAGYVKSSNTPLADASDIPVNSGKLFESDEYIVVQPKEGKFTGFDSLCTHEGCPVDVFDTPGEMDCSCHGTRYRLDGSVLHGPAKKPLPKKPIIIEKGKIYKAKKAK